jgi:hypothetical protein
MWELIKKINNQKNSNLIKSLKNPNVKLTLTLGDKISNYFSTKQNMKSTNFLNIFPQDWKQVHIDSETI